MSFTLPALGFGAFAGTLAAALIAVMSRYLPRRMARIGAVALLVWLIYVGAIGASGVLRNAGLRPPGIVYLALPVIACIFLVTARGSTGRLLALAVPLWLLVGLQVFRVGVEATLQALFQAGGNVEIVIALAAPAVAWLTTRGPWGLRLVWVWNILGLASLVNVLARGVLTAPGPLHLIHAEVPNLAIGQFPFSYIPGFMVPLALILHLLVFRRLRSSTSLSGAGEVMNEPVR
jgi:hypothetical protein